MLECGDSCRMSKLLKIVIKCKATDKESLADHYDQINHAPLFSATRFKGHNPTHYVLAGVHRILASQQASKALWKFITGIKHRIETARGTHDNNEFNPNTNVDGLAAMVQIQQVMFEASLSVTEVGESWPVYFYDINRPSVPSRTH